MFLTIADQIPQSAHATCQFTSRESPLSVQYEDLDEVKISQLKFTVKL